MKPAIETVIGQAEKQGWLDEAAFASQKVRAGRLAGRSGRALQSKLYQTGLPAEKIEAALAEQAESQTDAELAAALIFARKRRIGPFARPISPITPPDAQRSCNAIWAGWPAPDSASRFAGQFWRSPTRTGPNGVWQKPASCPTRTVWAKKYRPEMRAPGLRSLKGEDR